MKRSKTILPANDNQPATPNAVVLLAPVIDILARQAARMVRPANDNRRSDETSDLH